MQKSSREGDYFTLASKLCQKSASGGIFKKGLRTTLSGSLPLLPLGEKHHPREETKFKSQGGSRRVRLTKMNAKDFLNSKGRENLPFNPG